VPAHPYTLLDVFTDTPLAGNGLAVVHEADDLDAATMLAFARETRLSETTFVQASRSPGADYRNRILTVAGELPFAGHPSLGTAVAVARRRGSTRARLVQETGAGTQAIEVELDGEHASASMLQEPPRLGPEVAPAEALAPVGLPAEAADGDLPPQVVSTGLACLIAPIASDATLARAELDPGALAALLGPLGATVLLLCACGAGEPPGTRARARGFFHGGEDPATGSAAGSLCAYLDARRGQSAVVIDQGVEMGRPSRLRAAVEGDRVRVGGDVVVIADGTLRL
jgi:trans-2,3-dihydro-3-hydroxyanthranilate isomerase